MVQTITLIGGRARDGSAEAVSRVDLRLGDVVGVVGPTGSGKTTLINDLELLADGNTPSGRRVIVDGRVVDPERSDDPAQHPIALITQHTTFLSDLPVREFLRTHARVRHPNSSVEQIVRNTLDFANELTGEPIDDESRMTELSGGQVRALLIADAAVVCDAPVVLLDEVENAGIHRHRALERLRKYHKIFVFVTHDPRIALLCDCRIVMAGGAMVKFLRTDDAERALAVNVSRLDDALARLREKIRLGERLAGTELEGFV
jgi:ABC-type lipoprotein export system ATPase subunit